MINDYAISTYLSCLSKQADSLYINHLDDKC